MALIAEVEYLGSSRGQRPPSHVSPKRRTYCMCTNSPIRLVANDTILWHLLHNLYLRMCQSVANHRVQISRRRGAYCSYPLTYLLPLRGHHVPFFHSGTIFGVALTRVIHSLGVRLWVSSIQSIVNCHQGGVAEHHVLQDT